MARIKVILAFLQLCFCFPALAGDRADDLSRMRLRTGAYLGFRVITGQLKFKSDTVESDIQLTALPAIAGGLELWPTENVGLFADIQLGTGAEISKLGLSPDDTRAVGLNTNEYRLGGRYRWFLGPRATATALGVALGVHAFNQFVRDQTPAILLDRIIAGPQVASFATFPLWAGRLWLRSTVHVELPFFVRESPTDSGKPVSFLGYGAGLEAVMALQGKWSLQFDFDYGRRSVDFEGLATRGAGTRNGAANDTFTHYGLCARYHGL